MSLAAQSFTRPADTTAYTIGDLVANSVTAGSVVPLTYTPSVGTYNRGEGVVHRVRLKKSTTTLTSASFRVHLYAASPTIANGDNAAWSTTESTYLGSLDVTMDKAFTDGASGVGTPTAGTDLQYPLSTTTISALLEARAAYTPGSAEVFTLTIEVYAT